MDKQQGVVKELERSAESLTAHSGLFSSGAALSTLRDLRLHPDGKGTPWKRALEMSQTAGVALGQALLDGRVPSTGRDGRPVSLVGYGLGARVCFFAALTVARAVCKAHDKLAKVASRLQVTEECVLGSWVAG